MTAVRIRFLMPKGLPPFTFCLTPSQAFINMSIFNIQDAVNAVS